MPVFVLVAILRPLLKNLLYSRTMIRAPYVVHLWDSFRRSRAARKITLWEALVRKAKPVQAMICALTIKSS
jgi:hypothetical protein